MKSVKQNLCQKFHIVSYSKHQKLNWTPIISISHARFHIVVVFLFFPLNVEVQIKQTRLEHNKFLSGTLMTPSTWSITLLLDWSLYPGQPLWACWWQLGLLGLLYQGSFLRWYLKNIWFHTGESGFHVGTVYLLCTRRDQCWGQVRCAHKVLWWDIARGPSHCGLAICIKKYLKAKEELWKLKYFTMQKNIIFKK